MFPQDVKERAMTACGRRCCLCRKYCGVGMECHHIDPEAAGGPDTDDNCIPLCFDCHAEVGHYNAKHPKGTKFSVAELRAHRDRWYQMIKAGLPGDAPREHSALDQALFRKVVFLLGGSKRMLHFRDHDYGNSYRQTIEDNLNEVWYLSDLPECQFFNTQMAASFGELRAAIITYKKALDGRVWYEAHDIAMIPREWLKNPKDQERFDEAQETMNRVASGVWDAYCLFVQEGRRTLGIEPESLR